MFLTVHDQALSRYDISIEPQFRSMWGQEREDLEKIGAELFIPLKAKGEFIGIFAVGPKLSEETYSPDDEFNPDHAGKSNRSRASKMLACSPRNSSAAKSWMPCTTLPGSWSRPTR